MIIKKILIIINNNNNNNNNTNTGLREQAAWQTDKRRRQPRLTPMKPGSAIKTRDGMKLAERARYADPTFSSTSSALPILLAEAHPCEGAAALGVYEVYSHASNYAMKDV